MGLQHVGQANANQPYNGTPRKLQYNRMKNSEPQPATHSLCLSVLCIWFFCSSVVAPVGRLYSSVLPRRQTWRLQEVNVLQWDGQVVTRDFQTPPLHQVSPGLWLPHPPSQTHSETLPYSPLFTTRSAENKYIFWFYRCGRRGIRGFPDVFIQN